MNTLESTAPGAVNLDCLKILQISGPDRQEFLQGQITQDIHVIDPLHSALAGWTTAKGRLLAFGQILPGPDAIWWPLPADIVAGVATRLGMFVLRANVQLEVTNLAVAGITGLNSAQAAHLGPIKLASSTGAAAAAQGLVAARMIGDPTRALLCGPSEQVNACCKDSGYAKVSRDEWHSADIAAGVPHVIAATADLFIPQMLNLDLLNSISFQKGCYVGQEIVARTQNLGRIKRRMYGFRTRACGLQPGAVIHGPDNATGKVVSVVTVNHMTALTAVIAIEHADGTWRTDEATGPELERMNFPYAVG
jgi:folate-binding protein YgfZ